MFQRPSPQIALTQEQKHGHAPDAPDEVETVVGPSVHVEGDFASEGNIVVKGTVSGSVRTSKLLTVEKGAKIFADVKAGNAHISGEIRGNVRIACSVLVVEAGCLISGKVAMKGLTIEKVEPGRTEKRRGLGTFRRRLSDAEEEPAAAEDEQAAQAGQVLA